LRGITMLARYRDELVSMLQRETDGINGERPRILLDDNFGISCDDFDLKQIVYMGFKLGNSRLYFGSAFNGDWNRWCSRLSDVRRTYSAITTGLDAHIGQLDGLAAYMMKSVGICLGELRSPRPFPLETSKTINTAAAGPGATEP